MNSFIQRPRGARSQRGGLFAAAIAISFAGLIAAPAFADHDNDRGARGGHEGDRHEERGRAEHRHRYPIYAPDPIYYPRQESPGITLFIPLWDR